MKITALIFFVTTVFFAECVSGKAIKVASSRHSVVVAPETLVYEKPDLDSKPFAILPQGTRIPVSKGTRGEYQKFYRTRFQGKLGWVLTIDVRPEAEVRKAIAKAKGKKPKKGPFAAENEAEENQAASAKNPYVFSQSASLVFGLVDFQEDVDGVGRQESLTVYGFKISGPDVLIQGPVVDLNFLLHYGAPTYYDNLSSTKPSGFVVWVDALLVMPLRMRNDSLISAAAGPVLTLSSIQTSQGLSAGDSLDARIGAALSLTAGMRFDEIATRIDARYVIEGKSYPQFLFSLGTVF
ncbi:MAG: hypothetical protein J0L82_07995 [Deltaproteobacteria bacterium]|nr:hypothetical protein [Deltaproteobacteria bacterium]